MQQLIGDFVQVGPDGSRTEGKFYMQKPGRIRFEYDPPSPVELISDGQSTTTITLRALDAEGNLVADETPVDWTLAGNGKILGDFGQIGDVLFFQFRKTNTHRFHFLK